MRRSVAYSLAVLVFSSVAWSAERPVTVSPGHASKLALIRDACPTFSWSAVTGTRTYELVVYRVGHEGDEARPILQRSFSGSIYSWTPSLDSCLQRGGQYAWSVRALSRKAASDWSPPRLFEVASGPSKMEFEEAVGVVRQYLARSGEIETAAAGRSESSAGTIRDALAPALPPADTQLNVDGNVHASSFSGAGAGLTGVDADRLDSLDSSSFLRSDASDAFTIGTLTINNSSELDVNGTLRMDGPVFKNGTGKVFNFNADLLDGIDSSSLFVLSQNEIVTGIPRFNGGTSGSSSPFTVDSNTMVANLNADFVDGFAASAFVKATQVEAGKIQNSPSSASSPCPSFSTEVFSETFPAPPAVVLTPEGVGTMPDGAIGDTYCVVVDVTTTGFTHCCYGNNPRELHWIAISLGL